MYIKCWGSRGSIAVAGKEYNRYGGETTCIQIRAKSGETIILDSGTGLRKLGLVLPSNSGSHYHMLFTHTHWDHIAGFPFFKPLQSKNVTLSINNSKFSMVSVKEILANIMNPPLFPVTMQQMQAKVIYNENASSNFSIGSLDISTIPLSHPGGGLGYRFSENGKIFVFLTDNEITFSHPGSKSIAEYTDFCKDADLLFHDMEYTPEEYPDKKGWGHSAYTDVLELAMNAGVKRLGLFHINQERTDDEMDVLVSNCRNIAQKKGNAIDCFGVACGMEFNL
ncbi:conserved hypothetical protein [Desulfamplus magnetovallimortis]|uniref:Metallo-beta-lactamase domain-containing protein n=1 Tax=Desulfamplus magnetovallimortis TaxID=1246637 RepID=A0A1W1H5L8_9BACT|nr:MBL fold metallo-hydrolase [Desulfamplus magnetovallimortis]SLM27658.1 conserved hypothetical protein [Desulfamplus magnetovallimortis]